MSIGDKELPGRPDSGWPMAALEGPKREGALTTAGQRHFDLAERQASRHAIARMEEPFVFSSRELATRRLLSSDSADTPAGNAFRELRMRLMQRTGGANTVVMVTSVVPSGGSSFVACNLAAAIALDEARTALLLDCNVRAPKATAFAMPELPLMQTGLSDYLLNTEVAEDEIIQPTGLPRVRLIPAGTRRDLQGEFFSSVRMRQLMSGIARRYPERSLILDTPPVQTSADTSVLAELCDWVLLVVPYGRVTPRQLAAAATAVGESKLLGVVLNRRPWLPRVLRRFAA